MHNFMLMKPLLLSVDYELFFGDDAGTVENCMIRPLNHLMEILEPSGSKMTVFIDVMHYYRLKELEREVPDLRFDRELIDKRCQFSEKGAMIFDEHSSTGWMPGGRTIVALLTIIVYNSPPRDEEDETDINTITVVYSAVFYLRK